MCRTVEKKSTKRLKKALDCFFFCFAAVFINLGKTDLICKTLCFISKAVVHVCPGETPTSNYSKIYPGEVPLWP